MLRIATINTRLDVGNDSCFFNELSRRIKEESLDILCCQDVPVTAGGKNNLAVQLAEETGMTCSFVATGKKKQKVRGKNANKNSGTAILTGTSCCMLSSGSFSLSGGSRKKKQKAQFAVVRKDGDAILVINVQFPPMKTCTEVQRRQLQVIFEHPIMEKQYAAVLFCGEFGMGKKGKSLNVLKSQLNYKVRDGLFTKLDSELQSLDTHDSSEKKGRASIEQICILECKNNPVADIKFSNARQLLKAPEWKVLGRSMNNGAALDLRLTRIESKEVSQIHRYVSFIRPWSGVSESEQGASFQPSWLGQMNALGQVNRAC
jgi:endonuclease/exonuclease/phosphatase family metal-dependent hydrolase